MTTKTFKKVTVIGFLTALVLGYRYLYNRASIEVTNINRVARTLDYKVVIGLKTIEGNLDLKDPVSVRADYSGKIFKLNVLQQQNAFFSIEKEDGTLLKENTTTILPIGIVPDYPLIVAPQQTS